MQLHKVWLRAFSVICYLGASCKFSMMDLHLIIFQASGWCFDAPTNWKGQKLEGFESLVHAELPFVVK